MNSIINRLTEIEETAASIVKHAEEQKAVLDQEYEGRQKDFDAELEQKTRAHIKDIQEKLEKETARLKDGENGTGGAEIDALKREYSARHTEYAQNILKRMTEV